MLYSFSNLTCAISLRYIATAIAILFFGSACAPTTTRPENVNADGPPLERANVDNIPDAVPQHEPRSKYGNPETYEVFGKRYTTLTSSTGFVERGTASWYGRKFHGQRTSSGEPYDMYAMTAAHKHLPLPTYVRVTNLNNNRTIIVKVNDRGPFHSDRIIDLSYAAATKLGYVDSGTAPVEITALTPASAATSTSATSTQTGTVFVQVGAFSERVNAEQLRDRLSHVSAPINVRQENNSPLFRVRIGPLASAASADSLTKDLRDLGLQPYIVVE